MAIVLALHFSGPYNRNRRERSNCAESLETPSVESQMRKSVSVALCVLAGFAGLWHGGKSSQSVLAQGVSVAKAKWEYAVLNRTFRFVTNESPVRLRLPDKSIEAKNLRDLCQQLGQPTEEESTAVTLNLLGEQGWELVSFSETESLRDTRIASATWIFKRPK